MGRRKTLRRGCSLLLTLGLCAAHGGVAAAAPDQFSNVTSATTPKVSTPVDPAVSTAVAVAESTVPPADPAPAPPAASAPAPQPVDPVVRTPVTDPEKPVATPVPTTTYGNGICPDAVILVARGSGELQQPPRTLPSGTVLNGWEGKRLRPLLERIDTNNVVIIAMPADTYEASPFWTEIYKTGVRTSAVGGAQAAIATAVDFEDRTGCHPSYVLLGYSQGAMALGMAERILALSGRLAGSVYIGDPYLEPHDPALVGTATGGKGIMYRTGPLFSSTALRFSPDVVEYCETADPVCDDTLPVVDQVRAGGVQPHLDYFAGRPERAEREQYVVERMNTMIARGRAAERLKVTRGAVIPPVWRMVVAGPPPAQRSNWMLELGYQIVADAVNAADQQAKVVNVLLAQGQQPIRPEDAQVGLISGGAALTLLALGDAFAAGGMPAVAAVLSSTPDALSSGLVALNALAGTISSPGSLLYGTNLSSWASSDITLLTSLSAAGSSLSAGSL
ncbi:cutinase family protein [Corynebacterium choanae]|uniref:Cutinase n=1 Tax=Corynebacterium choanae TaxID=1862358 RepID=A0A3G6J8J4_9CORY|nr:cutinase family protein [Corynebacterium choanae]AZA12770.1 Cutinase [Corynebacterium choanae]